MRCHVPVVAIVYAGVWLALAMMFSIVFRSAATAALVALGVWLFLTVIWPHAGAGVGAGRCADGSALCRTRPGHA